LFVKRGLRRRRLRQDEEQANGGEEAGRLESAEDHWWTPQKSAPQWRMRDGNGAD
jgi:hypothetical protein